MGAALSCASKGSLLLVAAQNGDFAAAQELLKKNGRAALYHNFKDRTSPLIQASARGHLDLLQLILEAAVQSEGGEKAKRHCMDHTNSKHQTALIVACKHGHPDCVEYLVTNGADPLVCDERRHNTCLHFAALYGHSDCVHKLLGARTGRAVEPGRPDRQLTVAQILCRDEGVDAPNVRFIDRHNGWGLTALHIAVFQGSVHTVRALLRHGASLEACIVPAKIENSPIRCAIGSTALHIAALIGNIAMAKVILEQQESVPGLELRSRTDASGLRPQEYAQRARNAVLVHLLDDRLPVALLRQIWMNYSLEQAMPPRHQTLGAMLQKLKLMLNLEIIALQRNLAGLAQQQQADAADEMAAPTAVSSKPVAAGAGAGAALGPPASRTASARAVASVNVASAALGNIAGAAAAPAKAQAPSALAEDGALWTKRLEQVQVLLASVSQLHVVLQGLCEKAESSVGEWPPGSPASHEAVLDFILSTLITPRTVSAIVHAAKKLVCCNVMAMGPSGGGGGAAVGGSGAQGLPPDIEVQHGIALLTTALRAVDTCLQAATYLSNPASMMAMMAGPPGSAGSEAPPAAGEGVPSTATPRTRTSSRSSSFTVGTAAATVGTGGASVARTSVSIETNAILNEMSGPLAAGSAGSAPSQQQPVGGAAAAPTAGSAPVPPSNSLPSANAGGSLILTPPMMASMATIGSGNVPVAGLPPSIAAAMGQAQGVSLFSSHWSAHLHSLIAQLQWDIGVQRHRRRRQHAAAQAARATAAATNAAQRTVAGSGADAEGGQLPAGLAAPPPMPPLLYHSRSSNSVTAMAHYNAMAAAVADSGRAVVAGLPHLHSPSAVAMSIHYRRGDAPQDVLVGDALSNLEARENAEGGSRVPQAAAAARLVAALSPNSQLGLVIPTWGLPGAAGGGPQAQAAQQPGLASAPGGNRGEIFPRSTDVAASASRGLAQQQQPTSKSGEAEVPTAMMRAMSGEPLDADGNGPVKPAGAEDGSDEDEGASIWSDDDRLVCSICMDQPVAVLVAGCQHGLCVQCAFQLTVKGRELPSCPFCRQKIPAFEAKPAAEVGSAAAVKVGGGRTKSNPK